MKLNGKNIIFSEDVTLSGDSSTLGNNLGEVLVNQNKELNKLKSNVKWLYKYGGVGSGTSTSSGSTGGSDTWSISASISSSNNDLVQNLPITSGVELSLKQEGQFNIRIHINNPKGKTFSWTITSSSSASGKMTLSSGYTQTPTINLKSKGTLTILVRDEDGNENTISAEYTTSDYTFTMSYQTEDSSLYDNSESNEFLIQNITKGLYYNIAYTLSKQVDYIQYNIENSYTKQTYISEENITSRSGNIRIPIVPLSDVETATYSIGDTIKGTITIVYTDATTKTYDVESSFILIPKTLFLITSTKSGAVYTAEQSNPVYYNSGIITLYFKPYFGIKGQTAKSINASIIVYKDNEKIDIATSTIDLIERVESTWSQVLDQGNYKIQVKLSCGNDSSEFIYYLYVQEIQSEAYYYFNEGETSEDKLAAYPVVQNIYQRMSDKNTVIFSSGYLEQTTQGNTLTVPLDLKNDNAESDLYIAIGIQYSEINSSDVSIITFKDSYGNALIDIKQDKITYSNQEVETYIPTSTSAIYDNESFHLIQIYRRYLKDQSNENKSIYNSEFVVYIDGVLDGANAAYIQGFDYPTEVTFNAANYWINTFEIAFIDKAIQMDDSEMLMYRYNYATKVLGDKSHNNDIALIKDCFAKVQLEDKTYTRPISQDTDFFMEITDNSIAKLRQDIKDLPILIMSFNATDSDNQSLKEWLSYSYGQSGIDSAKTKTIGLQYYLNDILQNSQESFSYYIKPQGSTTSEYFGKNLTLGITLAQADDNQVAVFTPNFDANDTSTFLPEQEYTLKADVSDSSHSNNDAMGKFINANTTAFTTPYGQSSKYKSHIKNCLTGFPCIIIIKDTDQNSVSKNYFLGIYNFNLGRSSYFNLGYKDNKCFTNLSSGYGAYTITTEENALNSNIVIAEIQDNSKAHDYSQYDSSVLFLQDSETNSEKAMFGDIIPKLVETRQGKEVNVGDGNARNKIQQFVKLVSKAGGYVFDRIGKTMAEFVNGNNSGYNTINTVPTYRKQVLRNSDGYYYSSNTQEESKATATDLLYLLGDGTTTNPAHVDYQSVVEYYTTIMAFGMVDSVQKNQNIKSFDGGNKFYLAFYDMDTSFGKNNEGISISPWVFSDYWSSGINDNGELQNCNIYRDYSEQNVGYDYPSSYLFAIAKYVPVLSDTYAEYTFPQALWASWRANDGICRNADYVVDQYYAGHLDNVPTSLFNLNYRYKYLNKGCSNDDETLSSSGYSTKNIQMFSGRNIYRTRDWLNRRFHILDFYFNVGGFNRPIYTDLNDTTKNIIEPTIDETAKAAVQSNTDVIALRSAFTSNRFASFTPQVTALANTFTSFVINNSETQRYYFAEQTPYNLKINVDGSQQTQLYGSSNWININSFNFITNSSDSNFAVNSQYLKSVIADSGTVSSWSLVMPSLEKVSLTSPNFTGTLELRQNQELNMPNLSTIDIHGSKISLSLDNLPITTLNVSNVGTSKYSASSLTISNCNTLTSVNLSNSYIDTVKLSYTWGTSLSLTDVHFKDLTVTATKPGQTLTVANNSTLINLTATGFKSVTIHDCGNLNNVTINNNEQDNTTALKIYNCNATKFSAYNLPMDEIKTLCTENSGFSLNSSSKGIVDLSKLTSLTSIYLYNVRGFYQVKGNGNTITLPGYAFANTQLMYLDGNYTITGSYALAARYFTLRQSDESTYANIKIVSTDCTRMFSGNIQSQETTNTYQYTTEELQHIISLIPKNVTSLKGFMYARPISDYTDKLSDYMSTDTDILPLQFKGFTKLTSLRSALAYTGINYWNKDYIAADCGSTSGLNVVNFLNASPIYAPIDYLANIADKVSQLALGASEYNFADFRNRGGNITFIDPANVTDNNLSTGKLSIVNFNDLFSVSFPKLTYIYAGIINNTNVDLGQGEWNANTPNLSYMANLLRTGNTVTNLDSAFSGLKKLKQIIGCFGFTNATAIDLYTLFDWESISKTLTNYSSIGSDSSENTISWSTYITQEEYQQLMELIISSPTLVYCDQLFKNCEFQFTDAKLQGYNLGTNTKITTLNYFYYNVHNTNSSTYIAFDEDFFSHFNKVSEVRYMFAGTKWSNTLPLNFFYTRNIQNTAVEVEDGTTYTTTETYTEQEWDEDTQSYKDVEKTREVTKNTRINAILTQVTYTSNKITKIQGMFYNATFNTKYFDKNAYTNDAHKIVKNTVIGSDGKDYTKYFLKGSSSKKTLELNTEYQDLHMDADLDFIDQGREYNHSVILGDGNNAITPCMPPDFFYSKSNSTDSFSTNSYVFCNTGLTGYIPEHLFKNCQSTLFTNCFYQLDVLPIKQGKLSSGYCLYQFIADGFTKVTNLASAFNFKLRLPEYNEESQHQYTILSTDSIGSISSLRYAWPQYLQFFYNGSTLSNRHNNVTNYYYLMVSKVSNTDGTISIEPGIPISKIQSSMNYSYCLDNQTTMVLNGPFIKNNGMNITNTIKSTDSNNNVEPLFVFQCDVPNGTTTYKYTSNTLQLPKYSSYKSGQISLWTTNGFGVSVTLSTSQLDSDANTETTKNNYKQCSIYFTE